LRPPRQRPRPPKRPFLYAEKGDPKFEPAALRYLDRYISEASPSLQDVAGVAALFAERAVR